MMKPHHCHHLPLYAKCALEYLDCQSTDGRSIAKLNGFIDHYAQSMGQLVDEQIRFSAHAAACLKYPTLDKTGSLAVWTGIEAQTLDNCIYQPTQNNHISAGVFQ